MVKNAENIVYVGIALLVIHALGMLAGYLKLFHKDPMETVNQLNSFIFFLAIPAVGFKAIATSDLIHLHILWKFLGAYLVLRVFAAILCIIPAAVFPRGDPFGQFNVHWTTTTFMNSVVFGIPLLTALYGPTIVIYNVLASLSSQIFQLPVMLLLYEIRAYLENSGKKSADEEMGSVENLATKNQNGSASASATADHHTPSTATSTSSSTTSISTRAELVKACGQVLVKVVTNPPMIGIICGVIYSLSITSHKGKNKSLPKVLDYLCTWLGDCITALAAFCVGLLINKEFFVAIRKVWWEVILYLIAKLFLLPFLCMVVLLIFPDLHGTQARAAIYIACLPIAVASLTYAKKYSVGVEVMIACIVLGTILILPTVLFWEFVMNEMEGKYRVPIPAPKNATVAPTTVVSTTTPAST